MRNTIRDYKDLIIWQEARSLAKLVYSHTAGFPSEERFGISAQMRRAAISVSSNIAEGFARQHNKEYRQFLFVALGSCAELDTQCILAADLDFLEAAVARDMQTKVQVLAKMIRSLIKKL